MDVTSAAPATPAEHLRRLRGIRVIGEPGRAASELPAGEPPATLDVPDHVVPSEHSIGGLEIRAASVRGLMHRYRKQPRQDSFSVSYDQVTKTTVVVVCDGVGSLSMSHIAASFVTSRLPLLYSENQDWQRAIVAVNDELQTLRDDAVAARPETGEAVNFEMATTVVAAAITADGSGYLAQLARTDDSTVWSLSNEGTWTDVLPSASTNGLVHTGAVRALPELSSCRALRGAPVGEWRPIRDDGRRRSSAARRRHRSRDSC